MLLSRSMSALACYRKPSKFRIGRSAQPSELLEGAGGVGPAEAVCRGYESRKLSSSQGRKGGERLHCSGIAKFRKESAQRLNVVHARIVHLWRQRYPTGQPEQITFGPNSEQGLAVDPDGRSVITSVGVYQSAIWIHDDKGERSLSPRVR